MTELGYRKLKSMVYRVLERREETRNSDITLMIRIAEIYYPSRIRHNQEGKAEIFLEDLYSLPREDHIKRVRAYLQNEQNLFLPTIEDVRKTRGINEMDWKKWLEYSKNAYPKEQFKKVQSQGTLV